MSRIAGVLLFALLLVACQQGTQMSSEGTESQVQPTASASQQASGKGSVLSGRLGVAEVEGGCPYLEAADGTRYEVIYPNGWQLDRAAMQLRDPAGTLVAAAGDTVTIRGEVATDMVSTCQIGPIFQATEVVSVD
jgi:hypothetical protein